jgi:O-antigen ligase
VIAALLALVGVGGLAILTLVGERTPRLVGLGLVGVSAVGLAVDLVHVHRIVHQVTHRPLLAGVGLILVLGGLVAGTYLFLRGPWLLAFATLLAAPIRVPVHLGGQDAALLLPLYGVVACAYLTLAIELWKGVAQPVVGRTLGVPLSLYLGFAAVSLSWSADTHQGEVTMLFFLLPFAFLLVALARLRPEPGPLRVLVWTTSGLALLFALVGFFQFATGRIWWNDKVKVSNTFAPFFRVNSIFYDPSVYGRFLAVTIVMVVALLFLVRVRRPLVIVAFVAVLWLGLFLSYSQSSYVALAAGVFACGVAAWRLRAVLALGGAILAVLVIGLALPQLHAFRHAVSNHNLTRVTSDRSHLAGTGVRLLRDHPLRGVGLGGFVQAANPKKNANARGARGASHIMPLTVGAELGLPGLVLLGWLLVALTRLALRARERTLGLVAGVALLTILVHSLFYAAFFEDPLTWGLAAMLVVASRPAVMMRAP